MKGAVKRFILYVVGEDVDLVLHYVPQIYTDSWCWLWEGHKRILNNILNDGIPTDAEFDKAIRRQHNA